MINLKQLLNEFDRISDKEATTPFNKLKDKDINNDGNVDKEDSYLHKKLGTVALKTEANTSESGLTFVPRSTADATKFRNALDDSEFHYEWDAKERYFYFQEDEDNYDALELELQKIVDANDINGRFEGIFENASLDEDSTTAGVEGYATPFAFGKADDETMDQAGYKKVKLKKSKNESAYKQMVSRLFEIRYSDYKNDASASPKTKINKGISEVNKMLAEIEKIVHRNMKLKTEMGVSSNDYWKNTAKNFNRISERLVRINNKLKELSQ
jgi:hypothetical protein